MIGGDQHDAASFAVRNLEALGGHAFRQTFHDEFNIAFEAISTHGDNFQSHRDSTSQCQRLRQRVAIAVAQFHMQAPCRNRKVRSCFANDQAIDIACIVASSSEEIGNLQTMNTVFLDFKSADDVG